MKTRRLHMLWMSTIAAAPICVPSLVEATTRTWLTGSGQWQTAANWSGSQVPQTGDDVLIDDQAGTVTVNGKLLPAGNYTIGTDITSPRMLKISDWTQHANALAMTMPADQEKHKSNQLVFHKYGNQYFLCEIRSQESSLNVELPTSKEEKRARAETQVAKAPVQSSEIMIALN